jgi:hypothetical protein
MPPRIDPYANKSHRRIDIALIVITLLLMIFAFRFSAHSRTNDTNSGGTNHSTEAIQK